MNRAFVLGSIYGAVIGTLVTFAVDSFATTPTPPAYSVRLADSPGSCGR
jgi:hypothetical protein